MEIVKIVSDSGDTSYEVPRRSRHILKTYGVNIHMKLTELNYKKLRDNQIEMDRIRYLVEKIDEIEIASIEAERVYPGKHAIDKLKFKLDEGVLSISMNGRGKLIYDTKFKIITYGYIEITNGKELMDKIDEILLDCAMCGLSAYHFKVSGDYMPCSEINDICGYITGCRDFIHNKIAYIINSKNSTKSARNLCT